MLVDGVISVKNGVRNGPNLIVLISEIYSFRIFFQLIFIEGVFRKRCQRKAIIIYVEICK